MSDQRSSSGIVGRLRATALDKDNFPRMNSEKWLPVGLAIEAADEIERLRKYKRLVREWRDAQHEIDRTPVEERKNNLGPLHRLIAAHNALLKYANEEMKEAHHDNGKNSGTDRSGD